MDSCYLSRLQSFEVEEPDLLLHYFRLGGQGYPGHFIRRSGQITSRKLFGFGIIQNGVQSG